MLEKEDQKKQKQKKKEKKKYNYDFIKIFLKIMCEGKIYYL